MSKMSTAARSSAAAIATNAETPNKRVNAEISIPRRDAPTRSFSSSFVAIVDLPSSVVFVLVSSTYALDPTDASFVSRLSFATTVLGSAASDETRSSTRSSRECFRRFFRVSFSTLFRNASRSASSASTRARSVSGVLGVSESKERRLTMSRTRGDSETAIKGSFSASADAAFTFTSPRRPVSKKARRSPSSKRDVSIFPRSPSRIASRGRADAPREPPPVALISRETLPGEALVSLLVVSRATKRRLADRRRGALDGVEPEKPGLGDAVAPKTSSPSAADVGASSETRDRSRRRRRSPPPLFFCESADRALAALSNDLRLGGGGEHGLDRLCRERSSGASTSRGATGDVVSTSEHVSTESGRRERTPSRA
mmetsp:Transcript_15062/g.63512  ORF Transcript_15062/g.63512 Transcript_15062/m.63512 type:complete len:371 (-) Transcript_15062:783-1895(-)